MPAGALVRRSLSAGCVRRKARKLAEKLRAVIVPAAVGADRSGFVSGRVSIMCGQLCAMMHPLRGNRKGAKARRRKEMQCEFFEDIMQILLFLERICISSSSLYY
jgi:hypothetical protein